MSRRRLRWKKLLGQEVFIDGKLVALSQCGGDVEKLISTMPGKNIKNTTPSTSYSAQYITRPMKAENRDWVLSRLTIR